MRHATSWYAVPGERRFSAAGERRGRDSERPDGDRERPDGDRERPDGDRRAAARTQVNQFTLPPDAILIRRMHVIVAIVLQQLRAGADWGSIAAEYLYGDTPATPLGQAEAEFVGRRVR